MELIDKVSEYLFTPEESPNMFVVAIYIVCTIPFYPFVGGFWKDSGNPYFLFLTGSIVFIILSAAFVVSLFYSLFQCPEEWFYVPSFLNPKINTMARLGINFCRVLNQIIRNPTFIAFVLINEFYLALEYFGGSGHPHLASISVPFTIFNFLTCALFLRVVEKLIQYFREEHKLLGVIIFAVIPVVAIVLDWIGKIFGIDLAPASILRWCANIVSSTAFVIIIGIAIIAGIMSLMEGGGFLGLILVPPMVFMLLYGPIYLAENIKDFDLAGSIPFFGIAAYLYTCAINLQQDENKKQGSTSETDDESWAWSIMTGQQEKKKERWKELSATRRLLEQVIIFIMFLVLALIVALQTYRVQQKSDQSGLNKDHPNIRRQIQNG